jgi:epidermal growth factor receptor substrate 15
MVMRLILFFLLVIVTSSAWSQDPSFHIDGTTKNRLSAKPEAGVRIELIQSGNVVLQSVSATNGRYEIKGLVDFKKPFEVVFSKNGFVSKKLSFDYSKMNIEDAPPGDIRPFKSAEFEMVPNEPDVDLSFLNSEPVGKFYWDERKLTGAFDQVHNERIKLKIEKVIADSKKNDAANEAKYQALIKEADNLFNVQKWEDALVKYEAAVQLKPTEKHPNDRIRELDALILAKKKDELANQQSTSEYDNLIKAADALRDQKKYEQAILKYEEALRKKQEDYPQDQINLLRDLVQKDAKYKEAVQQADMFYTQRSFQSARDKYQLANKLKPEEPHPIARLAEIDKKMNEQNAVQEKKKKYEDAIEAGDALFNEKNYADAKVKYQEALTYESASSYATDRIKECDKKMADELAEKQRLEKINALLEEGNTLFAAAKWNESKAKYNEVIKLDGVNQTAKDRLIEIELKIKEEADFAAQKAKFDKLILEGDLAFKATKFEEAASKFQQALDMKEDSAVRTKLEEAQKKIKELEDKANAEKRFAELKAEGLKLAGEEKWLDAKASLTEAKNIKATDAQVNAKLIEVEAKIKANEALLKLEQEYNDLMALAAQKESTNDYDGAIAKYKEALLKKPAEALPKAKITELEELKKNNAKQVEINAKYDATMKRGKDLMASQKYLDAIKEFNVANTIKPEEKEPIDLAAECERLEKAKGNEEDEKIEKILTIAQNKFDEKDYKKSRELADRYLSFRPKEPRATELIRKIEEEEARDKNYTARMQEAEKLAADKNYNKAISTFEIAKQIKPSESLPQERIDELNKLIADQSSQAEREKIYKDFMAKGQLSETAKNWEQALVHYESALNVKNGDVPAQNKVNEMRQVIDDLANASRSEQDKLNRFNALIKDADALFSGESYLDAKAKYEEALAIFATNVYAIKQAEECERRERLRTTVDEERNYRKIVDKADLEFNSALYESAQDYYNRALTMRPTDPYPKKKLAEIDAILNPKIVGSVNLKPLGEPFPENSIMDGYAALVQADIERKNLRDRKVERRIEKATERESDLTVAAIEKQKGTTNEIYRITGTIGDRYEESDENRQAIVGALRNADEEFALNREATQLAKEAELRSSQGKLDFVVQEGGIDYSQREDVYRDNTSMLHAYSDALRIEMTDRNEKYVDLNLDSDQKLRLVESAIIDITDAGYERQKRNDQLVEEIVMTADGQMLVRSEDKKDALLKSDDILTKQNRIVEEKMEVDAKHAPGNKEQLEGVETVVLDAQKVRSEAAALKLVDNSGKLIDVNIKISEDFTDREIPRKENAELMKANDNAMNEASRGVYEKETLKYLSNKNLIESEDKKVVVVVEKGEEQVAMNARGVERLNEKANTTNEANALSDDEQRQGTRSQVETINANAEDYNFSSTKKQEKNSEAVKDMNIALDAERTNRGTEKQEKIFAAQQNLDGISSEKPEKAHSKNALGVEFPEGVTQESFTQNDENGLMKAIITRRIVVINGEGNVYVRTQTLHGITYSKNDVPTTEHVWNKETMGPHLQKHY